MPDDDLRGDRGQDRGAGAQAPPGGARSVKRLTDPLALRAVAHPVRIALLGLLRTEGPLTATRAAGLLGESSASCSFHLRQLAKYGMATEAGGGHGRERPWQATAMFTDVPWSAEANPHLAAAADVFRSAVAERYVDLIMHWLQSRQDEAPQWQQAAQFGDTMLYLTADELAELGSQIGALLDGYVERLVKPELRPPGARLVTFLRLAFPATFRKAGRQPGGGSQPGTGDEQR